MSANNNLKLYYTFGRETIDFSKNNYNIKNIVNTNTNGTLTNPLCLSSKYSFLGESCFICMKDLMIPERQIGTFTLPSLSLTNGIYLCFWLSILKFTGSIMNIVTINISSTYSYLICHNDTSIYVQITYNRLIYDKQEIKQINTNTNYLINFRLNSINGNVTININNDTIIFNSYNFSNLIQPTNIRTFTNIVFGDTNFITCPYMTINEIKLYDLIDVDNLVTTIYNNGNGILPKLMLNLSISTIKTIISQTEPIDIIFNGSITRLPLNYEVNLWYSSTKSPTPVKYNYIKDSINNISVLKTSLGNNNSYSNDMFSKIIYVDADQNIININTSVSGIRIIDVIDLNSTITSTLDVGSSLVELSDNTMYSSLVSTPMNTTPSFINNFFDPLPVIFKTE